VIALASVQTTADAHPLTWGYVLGAIALALLFGWPWLLTAYLESNFHRRGVARRRAHVRRQKGTAS
jgi:MFS superfamily sulfate permease-like transporter